MVEIEFISAQTKIVIQAKLSDLFEVPIKQYLGKTKINPKTAYFIAKGKIINPKNTVESYLASEDKRNKRLSILLGTLENDEDREPVIIKSKDIICPKCKEPCRIAIENFKLKLFDCKNQHSTEGIKIMDFNKTQNINISKILCDQCKIKNKGYSENNEFYICLTCKQNLCILCKSRHNSEHNIIKYDLKNYIYPKHNDTFIKYCEYCHLNICFSCDDDHAEHRTISLMKIKPDTKKIKEKLEEIQKEIEKLINFKKAITNYLNELDQEIKVMNTYYEINCHILKNYEIKNRNYQMLQNLKEIYENDEILEYLKNINERKNINDKLSDILNLNFIFKSEDLKKVQIIYNPKIFFSFHEKNIKIFGNNFVKNNKNNCFLLINGKRNNLCEFLEIGGKIRENEALKIKLIETNPITNMSYMFDKSNSLQSLSMFKLDTREASDMSYMFNECDELKMLPDISEWDTRNVTNMSHMFNKCNYLKSLPDISKWDTRNVTDMSYMFSCCHNLKYFTEISNWDIKKVKSMKYMFSYCYNIKSLPQISRWNTNVVEKSCMFEGCSLMKKEMPNKNLIFHYANFDITLQCFQKIKYVKFLKCLELKLVIIIKSFDFFTIVKK